MKALRLPDRTFNPLSHHFFFNLLSLFALFSSFPPPAHDLIYARIHSPKPLFPGAQLLILSPFLATLNSAFLPSRVLCDDIVLTRMSTCNLFGNAPSSFCMTSQHRATRTDDTCTLQPPPPSFSPPSFLSHIAHVLHWSHIYSPSPHLSFTISYNSPYSLYISTFSCPELFFALSRFSFLCLCSIFLRSIDG